MIRRVALAAALPLMMASYCGLAVDFTETFLITDPIDRIQIVVDDGNVDAVAYPREAILLKRHTFGYERIILPAEYSVEDGLISFEGHCKKQGVCSFDHLLELPLGISFDITMLDGRIDLGYIDADITIDIESGWFRGVELSAPTTTFVADEADADLDYAIAPQLVDLSVDSGELRLVVPTGSYRCDFEIPGDADFGGATVTCDAAATSTLRVRLGSGTLAIEGKDP